ncbi:ABC-type polysaccharide/polyol phosphate transport system, ATPase component [Magnetospirillum fulvum]|uniref:ABC-type polysaccharide/polyol phosphate transport system, ATPase component n=2 Tax=Magnetospirillum fulvum TaxID=1082 RepID=A0A1H6H356_MAGFU|nr:ABC-type polysaccharide/polyol phosphate transport system, ATPase component [Magnetospirillum fulvum]
MLDQVRGRAKKEDAKTHWALRDVNFTVKHGERIGIIGSNGAGKSTLLKILSRVVYPTAGEVRLRGRLTSLLEVGTGFNDNLSGRENIFLNASLYGLTRSEIEDRFDDIVNFSEIARFIETPVKNYSSGMKMRLAFAVAAHLDPDILLLDEVLAVGDMSFQRKCLERVDDLTSGGRTLFFVSHSMDAIMRYCDRCIWLDQGQVRADGDTQSVVSDYVEAVLDVKSRYTVPAREMVEKAGTAAESDGLDNDRPTAFLLNAEIISTNGEPTNLFPTSERVGVRFQYSVIEPGIYTPAIALYCPQGTLMFWSVSSINELEHYRLEPGKHMATSWIPADLLNVGTYTVTLSVVSPDLSPMKRHFVQEQVLSFHCVDPSNGETAQGILPRKFPGPLRPLLEWQLEQPVDKPVPSKLRFISEKTVQISVDTSGFCNARCACCPWPGMEKGQTVMGIDQFKLLLDRFRGFKFTEFALNSINEPFTDRGILEKMEVLIDSGAQIDSLFFSSNWLLPGQQQIDRFLDLVEKAAACGTVKSLNLNATISGISDETYHQLQSGRDVVGGVRPYKPLDFTKAIANVVAVAKGMSERLPRGPVVFNVKAYGFLFSLEEYDAFWRSKFDEAGIDPVFSQSRIKVRLNHGFTSFARSDSLASAEPRRCSMSWLDLKLVIGPGLDVGLCCHEGAHYVHVGNLGESTLDDLVSSKAYEAQLDILNGRSEPPLNHPCCTCEFYIPVGGSA